jgi:PAS domain S-box-containing protein
MADMPGFWERIFNTSVNRKRKMDIDTTTDYQNVTIGEYPRSNDHEITIGTAQTLLGRWPETAATEPARTPDIQTHYADFYENAPDMFFSIEASTARIIQCNQTMADTLGYSREELVGSLIFAFYKPDCMAKVRQAFRILCETGSVRNIELQVLRKNGTAIDVSLKASSVCNETGHVLYSHATWRDISDRKRAEAALRKAQQELEQHTKASNRQLMRDNQRLQSEIDALRQSEQSLLADKIRAAVLLGFVDNPIIMTNAEGIVDYLNPAAETLTGWPLDEARGCTVDRVFRYAAIVSNGTGEHPVYQCLQQHRCVEIDPQLRFIDRNGKTLRIRGMVAPAPRKEGGGLLGATLICRN